MNFADPFGLCPWCIVGAIWAVAEVGASVFDAFDVVRTGIGYLRGEASGSDFLVTAGGAALGVVAPGGGYGASSRSLRRNLTRSGQTARRGDHAHHIVAGNDRRAQGAREILDRFGIDINDAGNGVFLPGPQHQRIHTNRYYQDVTERLSAAGTREEALEILGDIANDLSRGGT